MKAIDVRVTGRVQGVSFRHWTKEEAERRGLVGWVRNSRDGSVLAHFEGPKDRLDEMKSALGQGPSAASVVEVIAVCAGTVGLEKFEVR
ncbi:hypothetical protein OG2516_08536 [Oceanicola granulosus HTCC2516]|uniref:Acylphosphatase n=1 Tax=Oceanicola granulosus (strain ATCC BAA-861 / DSM 15982 / KCTC 12143 / HTCC2516) TaxID=314256 RepID=Q2CBH3_OCEGH|nr:acylphosphatase [Oceanicola granulosus]EAR50072.1 hypothetical protein OG2516_08536 [Oceanicola granulosus HTCC2516]